MGHWALFFSFVITLLLDFSQVSGFSVFVLHFLDCLTDNFVLFSSFVFCRLLSYAVYLSLPWLVFPLLSTCRSYIPFGSTAFLLYGQIILLCLLMQFRQSCSTSLSNTAILDHVPPCAVRWLPKSPKQCIVLLILQLLFLKDKIATDIRNGLTALSPRWWWW